MTQVKIKAVPGGDPIGDPSYPPGAEPIPLGELERDIEAALKAKVPATKPLTPPTYGSAQREAIASVVTGIADGICRDIAELRVTLDEIEKVLLAKAASTKAQLEEHVSICCGLKDEVVHLRRVIGDLEVRAQDA